MITGVKQVITEFFLQHFRFHLEPTGSLQMPAYNQDNVIRGGFGNTFDYYFVSQRILRRKISGGLDGLDLPIIPDI